MHVVARLVFVVLTVLAFTPSLLPQSLSPFVYQIPLPNAQLISTGTTIALRHGSPLDPASLRSELFSVIGIRSGAHAGSVALADDQQTIMFTPAQPFAHVERVQVTVLPGARTRDGRVLNGTSFSFQTAAPAPSVNEQQAPGTTPPVPKQTAPASTTAAQHPQFRTVPATFPLITATLTADTADGYLFLSPWNWNVPNADGYLLILDNSGQPVFYRQLPPNTTATDFKKQPNGMLSYYDAFSGAFQIMDSSYRIVDEYRAGNGYPTDQHDLQLLPNGHALLMIYDPQTIDMGQIVAGGNRTTTVIGLVLQELDTARNVVFEWRSWDHFAITDTIMDTQAETIDYVHGNSVALDADGSLLLSSRHLNEVTKIDRQTGAIIWRLGGKHNQFSFTNDSAFFYQHDARRLPNGNLSLFDNRTNQQPEYTRAVEYQLDEAQRTATRVWQHRTTPDVYSFAMGSAQRLPNGNTLIGWGTAQNVAASEVRPDGSTALALTLGRTAASYHALRFAWQGRPATPPQLLLDGTGDDRTLVYSWNGATEVAGYRVYGGATPDTLALLATQPQHGFETCTRLTAQHAGLCFFQVVPLDAQEQAMQPSAVLHDETGPCGA